MKSNGVFFCINPRCTTQARILSDFDGELICPSCRYELFTTTIIGSGKSGWEVLGLTDHPDAPGFVYVCTAGVCPDRRIKIQNGRNPIPQHCGKSMGLLMSK